MDALVFYDQAMQAVAQVNDLAELKDIHDKAEALRRYCRHVEKGHTLQNAVAEVKIRVQRRIGELLREMPRARPGDNQWSSPRARTTLRELGLDYDQSSRCQCLATLDPAAFERYLAETKAAGKELTSAGVYREARQRLPRKLPRATKPKPPDATADAQGRTPYVQWVTALQQVAALLEDMNRLGGFEAIVKRLSPAQVEIVIEQVHRLHGQAQALAGDVERMGPVMTIQVEAGSPTGGR